jgi:hypothetical protein
MAFIFIEYISYFLFKTKLITRNSCVHGITLKIDNSRGDAEFLYMHSSRLVVNGKQQQQYKHKSMKTEAKARKRYRDEGTNIDGRDGENKSNMIL